MEFWSQKLVIMNLSSMFHMKQGYIPKAKLKAKKLCVNKIILESLLDCREVQDTDITSLDKSNLTRKRTKPPWLFSHWVPDKVVSLYVEATTYEHAACSPEITVAHTVRVWWDGHPQWRVASLLCLKRTPGHLLMGYDGRRGAHTIQTVFPSLPLLF